MKTIPGYIKSLSQSTLGKPFTQGVKETFGWEFRKGKSIGFLGIKDLGGRTISQSWKTLGWRAIGPAFVAAKAISSYRQDGLRGAATSVATDAATWGAFRVATSMLTNPGVMLGGLMGAGAYAGYTIGEKARLTAQRVRHAEMGAEVVDRFGINATMRQRSLMALNQSHINARAALGNEAALLSTRSYIRR